MKKDSFHIPNMVQRCEFEVHAILAQSSLSILIKPGDYVGSCRAQDFVQKDNLHPTKHVSCKRRRFSERASEIDRTSLRENNFKTSGKPAEGVTLRQYFKAVVHN